MLRNEGPLDRIARLVIGAVLAVVAVVAGVSSILGIVLGIVAVVLVATAVVGFCPLYRLLGLNTADRDRKAPSDGS